MLNWSDPNTYWLNITDIVLGIVTLASVAFVAQAAFREAYARLADRVTARMREDSHTLTLPELGLTMADGGEPVKSQKDDSQKH
jgi:hypothetical protein